MSEPNLRYLSSTSRWQIIDADGRVMEDLSHTELVALPKNAYLGYKVVKVEKTVCEIVEADN